MSVGGGLEIGVKFNLSLPDAQAGPERIPGSFAPPKAPPQCTKTLTTIWSDILQQKMRRQFFPVPLKMLEGKVHLKTH